MVLSQHQFTVAASGTNGFGGCRRSRGMSVFFQEFTETDRLLALSDGVIAIAITLLVLDLSVPTVSDAGLSTVLSEVTIQQWTELLGFVLSFLVIGEFWMLHRRIFAQIERHERGVIYLNLLFLLLVAFIPFATGVFTTAPNQGGVSVFGATLALTGLSVALLWLYASRRNLLAEGLTSRVVGIEAARFFATPLVFLSSVLLATVSPTLAIASWALLVPIHATLHSRRMQAVQRSAVD